MKLTHDENGCIVRFEFDGRSYTIKDYYALGGKVRDTAVQDNPKTEVHAGMIADFMFMSAHVTMDSAVGEKGWDAAGAYMGAAYAFCDVCMLGPMFLAAMVKSVATNAALLYMAAEERRKSGYGKYRNKNK